MSRSQPPSPSPPRQVVKVSSPGDLISAVPYLVGFVPQRSIVVLSLRGPRRRCGLVARLDLPAGALALQDGAADDSDPPARPWDSLVPYVMRDKPREVVIVVYDELPWAEEEPPWRGLVDEVGGAFAAKGVPVREAAYVTADRFWSYHCSNPDCCPRAGTSLDRARASEVAATFVAEGRAPLADRESLGRQLAPLGPLTRSAVAAAAARETDLLVAGACAGDERAWGGWQEEICDLFGQVLHRYRDGGAALTVAEAGRLLAGLEVVPVRDAVAMEWTSWIRALPGGDLNEAAGGVPAAERSCDAAGGEDLDRAVCRLLVDLARHADRELAAAPLTLLAMQCWANGDGGRANVAVERALDADPGYRMAILVDHLLQAGIAPAWAQGRREEDERAGTG